MRTSRITRLQSRCNTSDAATGRLCHQSDEKAMRLCTTVRLHRRTQLTASHWQMKNSFLRDQALALCSIHALHTHMTISNDVFNPRCEALMKVSFRCPTVYL